MDLDTEETREMHNLCIVNTMKIHNDIIIQVKNTY